MLKHYGNVQNEILQEEHDGLRNAKRVFIADSALEYRYMGKQTSGDYTFFGFKQDGGTSWYIMRQDGTDESAWLYAYGSSGWSTAWAAPGSESYGDPPDS
jgi:hypothetical protein